MSVLHLSSEKEKRLVGDLWCSDVDKKQYHNADMRHAQDSICFFFAEFVAWIQCHANMAM